MNGGAKFIRPSHDARSSRKCSWFGRSKISMIYELLMTELFVRKRLKSDVSNELRFGRSLYREVYMDIKISNTSMLGGVGKIVETDVSKFGKREYNTEKFVNGRWVFGCVERGSNKCFFRVVESRVTGTLININKTAGI